MRVTVFSLPLSLVCLLFVVVVVKDWRLSTENLKKEDRQTKKKNKKNFRHRKHINTKHTHTLGARVYITNNEKNRSPTLAQEKNSFKTQRANISSLEYAFFERFLCSRESSSRAEEYTFKEREREFFSFLLLLLRVTDNYYINILQETCFIT